MKGTGSNRVVIVILFKNFECVCGSLSKMFVLSNSKVFKSVLWLFFWATLNIGVVFNEALYLRCFVIVLFWL